MNTVLPLSNPSTFIGREKELSILRELHRQRRNVLIIGASGVGKSALVQQVKVQSPLLLMHRMLKLKDLLSSLEEQLQIGQIQFGGSEAKNDLLSRLKARGEPVAFDSVAGTSKAVARFILSVRSVVPVWIVCRSDLPHEIGRLSDSHSDFVRFSLSPLKLIDVRSHIALSVQNGELRKDALAHISALYNLCRGNPGILVGLLTELSRPRYKYNESFESCIERLRLLASEIESALSDRL
jgi:hypothetical protein